MTMVNILTSYNALDEQFYVIRHKPTGDMQQGYRGGSGPKLYSLGSARRVITVLSRRHSRHTAYGTPNPYFSPTSDYEILPVKVLLESPVE